MAWIVFDKTDYTYTFYDTEAEAKKEAEDILESYRGEPWPEDFEHQVGYAEVKAHNVMHDRESRKDFTDEQWREMGYGLHWDFVCGYELKEAIP